MKGKNLSTFDKVNLEKDMIFWITFDLYKTEINLNIIIYKGLWPLMELDNALRASH